MSSTMPDPQLTTLTGPSEVRRSAPALARFAGTVGLFALTVGTVSVVASQFGRGGVLGEGPGYMLAALGLFGLFVHASSDGDREVRRAFGAFAGLLLFAGVVLSLIPGPLSGGTRSVGHYFLPWGSGALWLALMFTVPFSRHENEEPYVSLLKRILLVAGGAMATLAVVGGLARPDFLVGPGTMLALLGTGFLAVYLGQDDASEGAGYRVASALGLLGGAALILALGQSIVPTVLYEGPNALKTPLQTWDYWKIAGRVALILGGFVLALFGLLGRGVPAWLRGALVVLGLASAGLFILASFSATLTNPPKGYLVPTGLLLSAVGLLYITLAVGVTSDSPLIVLTRRELAAFFYSPIAYFVLAGVAAASAIGYMVFVQELMGSPFGGGGGVEPIVKRYMPAGILGAFQVVFLVPALTMRLFSEEKRTGTIEVLLTAPVNEPSIVASKFLAGWIFFMLSWLPVGGYLIALRVVGGQYFDYRPMLSFYLALAACGVGFVGMGLFFSALTRNQIVAAVLTFAGMMTLLLTILAQQLPIGEGLQSALGKFDFLTLWQQSLAGQLPVPEVLSYLSFGLFWLFLTTKVLEARRWS